MNTPKNFNKLLVSIIFLTFFVVSLQAMAQTSSIGIYANSVDNVTPGQTDLVVPISANNIPDPPADWYDTDGNFDNAAFQTWVTENATSDNPDPQKGVAVFAIEFTIEFDPNSLELVMVDLDGDGNPDAPKVTLGDGVPQQTLSDGSTDWVLQANISDSETSGWKGITVAMAGSKPLKPASALEIAKVWFNVKSKSELPNLPYLTEIHVLNLDGSFKGMINEGQFAAAPVNYDSTTHPDIGWVRILSPLTVTIKIPDTNFYNPPFTGKEITATIEAKTTLTKVASVDFSLSFAPAENIVVTDVTGLGEFSSWSITPNPKADGSGVDVSMYGTTTLPDVTSTPQDLVKITFKSHENVGAPVDVNISKGTGNTNVGLNDGTTIDDVTIADQDGTENGTVIHITTVLNITTTISDACIGTGNNIDVVTPIPITIENTDNREILSCDLVLTYDDSLVEVRPSTLGTLTEAAGWESPTENSTTPGRLAITLYGTTPITGSGEILNLNVVAIGGSRGDTTNIAIQSAEFGLSDSTSGPPKETHNGQLTMAGLWGDSTGDNRTTGLDASFVAQDVVGLKELTNLKRKCGDVNLDGRLTGLDASFIAQKVVGLKDSLPPSTILESATGERLRDCYKPVPTAPALAISKSVQLEGIQYASANNPFTVNIDVDDADGILAGDISLTYSPDLVKLIGVTKTDLSNDYYLVQNRTDNKVSICMYGVKALSGSGSLLKFEFVPVRSDSSFNNAITFSKVDLYNETGGLNHNWMISTKVIPKSYRLLQNYPNPFNPETWIPYQLPDSANVTIRIYDISGHLVRSLDLGRKSAGLYLDRTKAAYWDGKNNQGESVASGIYYYYLKANDYSAFKKMIILK